MGIQTMTTRRHVELPTMPGTGHNVSVQITIGKRPPSMRTNPIHRMKRPIDVEQRDNLATHNEFTTFPGGDLVNHGNPVTLQNKIPRQKLNTSQPDGAKSSAIRTTPSPNPESIKARRNKLKHPPPCHSLSTDTGSVESEWHALTSPSLTAFGFDLSLCHCDSVVNPLRHKTNASSKSLVERRLGLLETHPGNLQRVLFPIVAIEQLQ